MTVKFELDGKQIEAYVDETIWQAANRHDNELPHLCYLPEPGYRADGNCRACMVEIEGERVLAASCIRKPTEGMKVSTNSERAQFSRKLVFEMLATDQPEKEIAHQPDSPFWRWNDCLDETVRNRTAVTRQWQFISMLAYTAIFASEPAAKFRSMMSSAWHIAEVTQR